MQCKLYYFHDPMCSWCWAFRPLWIEIVANLPDNTQCHRVLGGLAPDTNQVMPLEMQAKLQAVWQKIQHAVPGTQFNFDFWNKCTPRRSTYAACRAVIAARRQNPRYEETMILAIQQAYYLEARNPADMSTLKELANEIGLEKAIFSVDIESPTVHQALLNEIEFTRRLGVKGFPTLVLEKEGGFTTITFESSGVKELLEQVKRLAGN